MLLFSRSKFIYFTDLFIWTTFRRPVLDVFIKSWYPSLPVVKWPNCALMLVVLFMHLTVWECQMAIDPTKGFIPTWQISLLSYWMSSYFHHQVCHTPNQAFFKAFWQQIYMIQRFLFSRYTSIYKCKEVNSLHWWLLILLFTQPIFYSSSGKTDLKPMGTIALKWSLHHIGPHAREKLTLDSSSKHNNTLQYMFPIGSDTS